jgi:hypothetical protein
MEFTKINIMLEILFARLLVLKYPILILTWTKKGRRVCSKEFRMNTPVVS